MSPTIALLPSGDVGVHQPDRLLAAGIRELWCHPELLDVFQGSGLAVHAFHLSSSGDRDALLAAMQRKDTGPLLLLPGSRVHPLALDALQALQRDDPQRSVLGLYRWQHKGRMDVFDLQTDASLHASREDQPDWLFMRMALLAAGDIEAVLAYLRGDTERIRTSAQVLGCPLPDPGWVPDPGTGRTLFLDRDGVINRRIMGDYVRRPEDFHFLPGVPEALARLRPLFRRMVVVTNQQGIGKGLMREADLAGVHQKMVRELEAHGVHLDGIYHCPGLAAEGPVCRKPLPGMALMALRDHPDIAFQQSVMVGDTESDMRFGARLGMHTVLIGQGSERAGDCAPDLPSWAERWLGEGH